MARNYRTSRFILALAASLAATSGHAQDDSASLKERPSVVVTAIRDRQQIREKALDDAVAAYQELAANWRGVPRCDLYRLCADEGYTIQVSDAYVQLLYSPTMQPGIKLASFPLQAIRSAGKLDPLRFAVDTPEYSYAKLQRSLSTVSRETKTDREKLYKFPDPFDNPFLPWPPHMPSSHEDVSRSFQVQTTLGGIASQIQDRVSKNGYDVLRYFSVPGGFAVATDVERVGRDRPIKPADRWTVGKRGGFGNLFDYWKRLLAGEDDRFRVFVFLVTDADIQNEQEDAGAEDLRRWKVTGRPSLSRDRAATTALRGTRVWLYVYEFNASRSKTAELIQNDRDPLRIQDNKAALGLP